MAKIRIDDIRKAAIEHNWKLISEEYKNLDTDLVFECEEGHRVYLPYKKVRDKWECPLCKKNKYYNFDECLPTKKKDVQRVLGLDQATHITGYSIFDGKDLVSAGTFEADADDEIERDVQIKDWLVQFILKEKIDIVGMEDIQLQQFDNKIVGVTTYRTLARLQGALLVACKENGVDAVVCAPATWRSHCGVKGRTRADKKRSMQNLVKDWFDVTVSDDVADAIGLGKYVADKYKKKVEIYNWE